MVRKFEMGMVGGGKDALMGAVHRTAASLDDRCELVCGAFSSTKQKSIDSGRELGLPADRVYGTYREMFRKEQRFAGDDRMDFVSIVTPNNMHYPVAMAALDAGLHVVCDKPMTMTLDEAQNLQRKILQTGRLFCLTHTYTGYPMVKEARELLHTRRLGRIRRVVVEYPQGWLASRVETAGQKQAAWRTDPRRAGATCCIGDLGSHCANLAEYITRHPITEVCADLSTFVNGRQLDDDGSVLLRFEGGATGLLWASQIAIGEENALTIRIYAEKGAITWRQQEPNTLTVHWLHKPTEIRRCDSPGRAARKTGETATLPADHPERHIEALANVYREFFRALECAQLGQPIAESDFDYPTVADGIRSMAFLDAVVKSNKSKEKWVALEP